MPTGATSMRNILTMTQGAWHSLSVKVFREFLKISGSIMFDVQRFSYMFVIKNVSFE